MPDLEMKVHAALDCVLAREVHPIKVADTALDWLYRDGQPGASVHPRPPSTPLRHLRLGVRHLSGELSQSGNVEWWPVVQAEIDIGVRRMIAAGPTTSQHHSGDAGDSDQSLRQPSELILGQQLAIVIP